MAEHTLAVTLAAPDDTALGEVDALAQAGLAWAICTTPGATVTIGALIDSDLGHAHRRTWWQRARRQLARVATAATLAVVALLIAAAIARATP